MVTELVIGSLDRSRCVAMSLKNGGCRVVDERKRELPLKEKMKRHLCRSMLVFLCPFGSPTGPSVFQRDSRATYNAGNGRLAPNKPISPSFYQRIYCWQSVSYLKTTLLRFTYDIEAYRLPDRSPLSLRSGQYVIRLANLL